MITFLVSRNPVSSYRILSQSDTLEVDNSRTRVWQQGPVTREVDGMDLETDGKGQKTPSLQTWGLDDDPGMMDDMWKVIWYKMSNSEVTQ